MTLEDILTALLAIFTVWLYCGAAFVTPKLLRDPHHFDKDKEQEE